MLCPETEIKVPRLVRDHRAVRVDKEVVSTKKRKKWTALLCAGALLVSLAACGTQTAGSDSMAAYAGQSVTGQITALDGTSVTLQMGELSQSDDMQPSDATPPEKPEGDATGETSEQTLGRSRLT